MDYKHNKEIVPLAKALRKNMTKEEKRLWYDCLREYPIRFIRQKVAGKYIVDFWVCFCYNSGSKKKTENGVNI